MIRASGLSVNRGKSTQLLETNHTKIASQMAKKVNEIPQVEKFREAARELETDESEENFDRIVKQIAKPDTDRKVCPECGHEFKGNGWDGIDAHWKSKHEKVMPYDEAWPLLKAGTYGERQ